MTHTSNDDPSDGMNCLMDQTLTMYGANMSAQVREVGTLASVDPLRIGPNQTTMAIYHYEDAPRSPEVGSPWTIGQSDMERLRDLLWCAEQRGLLPRVEVVQDPNLTPSGECHYTDVPDEDLPGMWESADFSGGQGDVNPQVFSKAAVDMIIDEFAGALLRTVEYVGAGNLPARRGWSWYDVMRKYRADMLTAFVEKKILP